jgi:uncharacterized protein YukE
MTMTETIPAGAEHLEEFLRLEQAATELVAQLESLRSETEHYAGARGALDETVLGIVGAAGSRGTLSARVADVIEALRRVGTAELLAGQERLATSMSGFEANVDGLGRTVEDVNRTLGTRLGDVSKHLETIRAEVRAAGEDQVRRQQSLDGVVAAAVKNLRGLMTTYFLVLLAAVGLVGAVAAVVRT